MAGYFAFPPPSNDPQPLKAFETQQRSSDESLKARLASQMRAQERAWEDRCRRDAVDQARKLQSEHERASLGELEWVRSGGWLRDEFGRKDKARTERLRAEVRLRDQEQKVLERWNTYEARWRGLLASSAPVAFVDIPWPVASMPASTGDLVFEAVVEFIDAPLRLRANTSSRKDRIRSLLLRWHPDKLSIVVARTVDQDLEAVRAGINAVFRFLKALQDSERHSDS